MSSDPPIISRDDSGRVEGSVSSSNEFRGPLGIWPWPILNMILSSNEDSKVQITRVNRDNKGRIESIEEIKL